MRRACLYDYVLNYKTKKRGNISPDTVMKSTSEITKGENVLRQNTRNYLWSEKLKGWSDVPTAATEQPSNQKEIV